MSTDLQSSGAPDKGPSNRLPFERWWPFVFGVAAGLMLRLVFSGSPGQGYATMMASFIYLSPIVVGAVTVYVAERTRRRTWTYYASAAFLANLFYVGGTLVFMIEGLICAVVILPVFATLGMIGGLVMGAVCRMTQWPKQTLLAFWALPLLLGGIESHFEPAQQLREVEHMRVIRASPERIWSEIHAARDIRPDEVARAWFFRIGVPLPLAGVSAERGGEKVRTLNLGKDVHFEQVAVDWEENRRVRWSHRYQPDSFPPYALDEHVVLGGHYFDITTTTYELRPVAGGTELHVRMAYRVSTTFNWYAEPVARLMIANFEQVLLDFYRLRCEEQMPPRAVAAAPSLELSAPAPAAR